MRIFFMASTQYRVRAGLRKSSFQSQGFQLFCLHANWNWDGKRIRMLNDQLRRRHFPAPFRRNRAETVASRPSRSTAVSSLRISRHQKTRQHLGRPVHGLFAILPPRVAIIVRHQASRAIPDSGRRRPRAGAPGMATSRAAGHELEPQPENHRGEQNTSAPKRPGTINQHVTKNFPKNGAGLAAGFALHRHTMPAYRPNVAFILRNAAGEILVCERSDWAGSLAYPRRRESRRIPARLPWPARSRRNSDCSPTNTACSRAGGPTATFSPNGRKKDGWRWTGAALLSRRAGQRQSHDPLRWRPRIPRPRAGFPPPLITWIGLLP